MDKIKQKGTVQEFGDQFKQHSKIDDHWGSIEMLRDIVRPFNLDQNTLENKTICEIGSGSGRILKNLSTFSPKKIFSIEPSDAIEVAKENKKDSKTEIIFKKITAQEMQFNNEMDYVFSLGVIHHIPDDLIVCKKIYNSLKPNGKFIIWLYGKEGNELYLIIFNNLRKVTKLLPDKLLNLISVFLNFFLSFYIYLCKYFNLPLKKYIVNVIGKCSFEKRKYIIFDQLNPSYSKYYTKDEVNNLLDKAGFKKIQILHRHGYSWTAVAEK